MREKETDTERKRKRERQTKRARWSERDRKREREKQRKNMWRDKEKDRRGSKESSLLNKSLSLATTFVTTKNITVIAMNLFILCCHTWMFKQMTLYS